MSNGPTTIADNALANDSDPEQGLLVIDSFDGIPFGEFDGGFGFGGQSDAWQVILWHDGRIDFHVNETHADILALAAGGAIDLSFTYGVRDDAGQVIGSVAVARDVTERVEREKAARAAKS
mgnify:CR=1 FL=1